MALRGRKGTWGLGRLCRSTRDRSEVCLKDGQCSARCTQSHQGGPLPELCTCRASGRTSLVVASTATGQVKQEGAELTLLV